ncbi:hypothetical protein QLX08_007506 [Tetragonisca angustula]|uniref:Uncharacterized protein n=1 Tax=Tetragonisca angustula TaxID=166442 RepID=A0AAW0ZS07_9HYME
MVNERRDIMQLPPSLSLPPIFSVGISRSAGSLAENIADRNQTSKPAAAVAAARRNVQVSIITRGQLDQSEAVPVTLEDSNEFFMPSPPFTVFTFNRVNRASKRLQNSDRY